MLQRRKLTFSMIKNTACLLRYALTDMMTGTLVSIALRGRALKCIVLGINQQSCMLILPWPCAECVENSVCGAKDNTAAFVLKENNTADDAALCRCSCPRSHVSFCQVTRPDKVAYCKVQMIRCTDLSLNSNCIVMVLHSFIMPSQIYCIFMQHVTATQ